MAKRNQGPLVKLAKVPPPIQWSSPGGNGPPTTPHPTSSVLSPHSSCIYSYMCVTLFTPIPTLFRVPTYIYIYIYSVFLYIALFILSFLFAFQIPIACPVQLILLITQLIVSCLNIATSSSNQQRDPYPRTLESVLLLLFTYPVLLLRGLPCG